MGTSEPDDPFLGQSGCCPHCGHPFPSSTDVVETGVYAYLVEEGEGRAGVCGGTIIFGKCSQCDTPVCAPGTGRREWLECDPRAVAWYRDRSRHLWAGSTTPRVV
jgi:hypothetical protein